jgi:hypothetical protein
MEKLLKHAKFGVALAGVIVTALDQAVTAGGSTQTVIIAVFTAAFVWLVPNAKDA